MIPRVRTWTVRAYKGRQLIGEERVDTINRQFARWLAFERNRRWTLDADRVTCSTKEPRYANR